MHQLLIIVLLEVAEEGAIALGLALFGPAQHGVDLIPRLARQDAAQQLAEQGSSERAGQDDDGDECCGHRGTFR